MNYQRSRLFFRAAGSVLLLLSFLHSPRAATLPVGFTELQVASGLSNPTAMAFAPDGRLFVCEQGGRLRVIKDGSLLRTPFLTVVVDSSGERGLLGVALDPNFSTNQFVYAYYTATTPATHNRVSRFTANGDVALAGSEVVLLDLNNLSGATNHNGGAIHFGPDGKLYIGVGENANSANSQTLNNLLGKMLRINSDGTIPSDNPFYNTASGVNRAIWALGLRNPFTFAFQPGTGRMFINDVGQNTWEEIDDGIAGSNYGWPTCEGFCSPPNAGLRDPLFEYGHGSGDTTGCAITGGAFYNPTTAQFPGDYVGKYFFSDLCGGWIRRYDPAGNVTTDFASGISSPVDLAVRPDGSLYYLARGAGAVFKVQFAPTADQTSISGLVTTSDGAPLGGVLIQLSGSGSSKAITDGSGRYTFTGLEAGGFYSVTPQLVNYSFTPSSRSFSLVGGKADAAFTATPSAITANPLDNTEFFVRQHYLDFLGREPDQGGLDYWSNEIEKCGQDVLCILSRRVGVSAAYFTSLEFQDSGYFVYRFYKAGLGRQPNYSEFILDRGSVVGGPELEANKTAYTNQFITRTAFTEQYPDSMTPEQYVDKLNSNIGGAVGQNERDALVAGLKGGAETRATVLQKVADNQVFQQREYNAAFVLMQYFGYLRRDPDAGGYQFWLGVMNGLDKSAFTGMTCAFITSREYQERFSPVVTHSNSDCGKAR